MNNLEEVDPADEARTYRQQSFPQAPARWPSAGSTMHFLLALVLLRRAARRASACPAARIADAAGDRRGRSATVVAGQRGRGGRPRGRRPDRRHRRRAGRRRSTDARRRAVGRRRGRRASPLDDRARRRASTTVDADAAGHARRARPAATPARRSSASGPTSSRSRRVGLGRGDRRRRPARWATSRRRCRRRARPVLLPVGPRQTSPSDGRQRRRATSGRRAGSSPRRRRAGVRQRARRQDRLVVDRRRRPASASHGGRGPAAPTCSSCSVADQHLPRRVQPAPAAAVRRRARRHRRSTSASGAAPGPRAYHADVAKLLPLTYAVVAGARSCSASSTIYLDIVDPIEALAMTPRPRSSASPRTRAARPARSWSGDVAGRRRRADHRCSR